MSEQSCSDKRLVSRRVPSPVGGFTLLELLIVMAILGITVAFALPSFRDQYAEYRVRKAVGDFQNAISLAKSEAVKRGEQINVSAVSSDWSNGWRVVIPATGGDELIRAFDALTGINVVKSGGGAVGQISFQEEGYRNDFIASSVNPVSFKIRFCDARNKGREVDLVVTGVSRVTRLDSNCKP